MFVFLGNGFGLEGEVEGKLKSGGFREGRWLRSLGGVDLRQEITVGLRLVRKELFVFGGEYFYIKSFQGNRGNFYDRGKYDYGGEFGKDRLGRGRR